MSMPPPPPPGDPFPQPPGFRTYPVGAPAPAAQGKSGMAVASLVCSLVGVIPCFWLFQIMGLLGTIFGFVGLKQTRDGRRGGRGLATAGVVIGIVLLVACIAFWIWFATHANCERVNGRMECTTD
ncbi:MAG TPA: DUF4190 domain-containing protein [Ilumatobacteraceae bacterium]